MDEWMSNGSSTIKRNNFEKYEEINRILWDWYVKARAANISVDGPLLKEEARLIAKQLGVTTFKGTEGWFSKWKQRHNIAQFNIAGEEGDVSKDTVESWSERVKELTKGYAAAEIWNEDEIGAFWRALPRKSLSEKGKRCRGGKNAKQRICRFLCERRRKKG
ncbi:tigger transposable element-derived protein 6-like [Montipora capricornis]|uniref:tigger transposable element-derived protein 6-like n=1 Tax=Montipora capricornis TaxID=246305 RepID=UPI0035F1B3F3